MSDTNSQTQTWNNLHSGLSQFYGSDNLDNNLQIAAANDIAEHTSKTYGSVLNTAFEELEEDIGLLTTAQGIREISSDYISNQEDELDALGKEKSDLYNVIRRTDKTIMINQSEADRKDKMITYMTYFLIITIMAFIIHGLGRAKVIPEWIANSIVIFILVATGLYIFYLNSQDPDSSTSEYTKKAGGIIDKLGKEYTNIGNNLKTSYNNYFKQQCALQRL